MPIDNNHQSLDNQVKFNKYLEAFNKIKDRSAGKEDWENYIRLEDEFRSLVAGEKDKNFRTQYNNTLAKNHKSIEEMIVNYSKIGNAIDNHPYFLAHEELKGDLTHPALPKNLVNIKSNPRQVAAKEEILKRMNKFKMDFRSAVETYGKGRGENLPPSVSNINLKISRMAKLIAESEGISKDAAFKQAQKMYAAATAEILGDTIMVGKCDTKTAAKVIEDLTVTKIEATGMKSTDVTFAREISTQLTATGYQHLRDNIEKEVANTVKTTGTNKVNLKDAQSVNLKDAQSVNLKDAIDSIVAPDVAILNTINSMITKNPDISEEITKQVTPQLVKSFATIIEDYQEELAETDLSNFAEYNRELKKVGKGFTPARYLTPEDKEAAERGEKPSHQFKIASVKIQTQEEAEKEVKQRTERLQKAKMEQVLKGSLVVSPDMSPEEGKQQIRALSEVLFDNMDTVLAVAETTIVKEKEMQAEASLENNTQENTLNNTSEITAEVTQPAAPNVNIVRKRPLPANLHRSNRHIEKQDHGMEH
ncbi:MAG: hypothetical protein IJA61_02385 [Clostridia bacterium]|nr:hypothetical protein [Clostridia bacterium]